MATADKIGREPFVNKVCGLVDELGKDQNRCLSINGAWGSGKSVVMEMIQERFARTEYRHYIVVNYDAWKNNFYSDPLIAMLYCILDALESVSCAVAKKRVKSLAQDYMKQAITTTVDIAAENSKIIGVIAKVVKGIRKIIKEYKNTSLTNHKRFDDYKSYSTLLNETINLMNLVTACEICRAKQTRLIVLVDEIDRCLPNEQLIVLERLHHLFNVKNCAVIVAINKEAVCQNFENTYGGNGKEYLRKFFDYNFELSLSNAVLFRNLVQDEIVDNHAVNIVNPISKQQVELLQDFIFVSLKDKFGGIEKIDNRTVKRLFINFKSIVLQMPEKKIDFAYLLLISYLVCCNINYSNNFRRIKEKTGDDLIDIFDKYSRQNPLATVKRTHPIATGSNYRIYSDIELNTVNFYLNMWQLANKYNNCEIRLKTIFYSDISLDPDYMKKVEFIINQANQFAE